MVDRAGEQYKVGFDGAVVNHKDAVLTLKPVIKGSEVELKNALIYKNGVFYTDLSVYATLMFDLFHEDADFFIDATNGRKVSLFDVNNFANLSYINTLKTILTPIKTDALENKVKQVNDTTYRLSFDTTDNKSVTDAVKEALARNDSQIQSDLVAFYSAFDNNAYLNACLTAASSLLGDEGLANNIASLRTLSDIRTLIGHTASGKFEYFYNVEAQSMRFAVTAYIKDKVNDLTKTEYENILSTFVGAPVLDSFINELISKTENYLGSADNETYFDIRYDDAHAYRSYDYQFYKMREEYTFADGAISRADYTLYDVIDKDLVVIIRTALINSGCAVIDDSTEHFICYTTDPNAFPADVREANATTPQELANTFRGERPAVGTVSRDSNTIVVETKEDKRTTKVEFVYSETGVLANIVFTASAESLDIEDIKSHGYTLVQNGDTIVATGSLETAFIYILRQFGVDSADISADALYKHMLAFFSR